MMRVAAPDKGLDTLAGRHRGLVSTSKILGQNASIVTTRHMKNPTLRIRDIYPGSHQRILVF